MVVLSDKMCVVTQEWVAGTKPLGTKPSFHILTFHMESLTLTMLSDGCSYTDDEKEA